MTAIKRGTVTGETDLPIFFDKKGCASDPYSIVFDLVDCTNCDTSSPVVVGQPNRIPVKIGVGKYYAPITIGDEEPLGSHKIVWKYKETSTGDVQIIERGFDVIPGHAVDGEQYPDRIKQLIYELRKKLRDINPDRDYHFSPPQSGNTIAGFNQCRGYRWPDEQLANHLAQAANYVNLYAPISCFDLCDWPCLLEDLLLRQAMVYAFYDMASLWINEEFNYSLNGISLDISRSDKYSSLAQQLQDQVDKILDQSKQSMTRSIKGLRQSPYTFSRSAALGPYTSGLNLRRFVRN